MISWRKDGEDVNEDVELRETLPNQDGSFQKRSILKVPAEDLQKHTYTCVIQHSSLKEELVLEVPKGGGSDGGSGGGLMAIIVGVLVVLVALVALVVVVAGIMVWKKKNYGEYEFNLLSVTKTDNQDEPHPTVLFCFFPLFVVFVPYSFIKYSKKHCICLSSTFC
ncbi:BOLA class I histocompatibility antigen, alpha chain BL3-6-like [Hemibagrus wyckioides]|uniref:BOLA class I histocompatibility antigen, alpha chain BL3-6-like n=1 Tax=Hemibagrus wyckioides TaxID=337641 RepID=UPI00266CFB95|nr:BOLA class I histocompatibility antigen, alpha chain BL3-6-like [Hemibagrus wyckioides]